MTLPRYLLSIVLLLALSACDSTAQVDLPIGIEAAPRQQGNWLLINYWAQWCAPCREEIPELNVFAREQRDTLLAYAVNFDDVQGDELLAQAASLNIKFALLATDPAKALGYPRPMVLPTTVLINPQGELHARLLGPQTGDSLLAAMQAEPQKLAPPRTPR